MDVFQAVMRWVLIVLFILAFNFACVPDSGWYVNTIMPFMSR